MQPLLAGVVGRAEAVHVVNDLAIVQVHRVLLELGDLRIGHEGFADEEPL